MKVLSSLCLASLIVAASVICSVQATDGGSNAKPVRLWLDDLFFSPSESFFVRVQFSLGKERLALGGETLGGFLTPKGSDEVQRWDLYWTVRHQCYRALTQGKVSSPKRVNCLPGGEALTLKKSLVHSVQAAYGGLGYGRVLPRSFLLPEQYIAWHKWMSSTNSSPTTPWVLKANVHRGKGVSVVPQEKAITSAQGTNEDGHAWVIAQECVPQQFTYEGRRGYVRVWAVITSVTPFRVLMYQGGVLIFGDAEQPQTPGSGNGTASQKPQPGQGIVNLWMQDRSKSLIWTLDDLRQHAEARDGKEVGRAKFDAMWQGMLSKTGLAVAAGLPQLRTAADLDNYAALDTWMRSWGVAQNGAGGIGVPPKEVTSIHDPRHKKSLGGKVMTQQEALAAVRAIVAGNATGRQPGRKLAQMQQSYKQAEAASGADGVSSSSRRLMETAALSGQQQAGGGGTGSSASSPRLHQAGVNLAEWRAGGYLTRSAGYEVLGLDFLLDQELTPTLVEINSLPSFAPRSSCGRRADCKQAADTYASTLLNRAHLNSTHTASALSSPPPAAAAGSKPSTPDNAAAQPLLPGLLETGFDLEKHGFIRDLINLLGFPASHLANIRPLQQAWDRQHWGSVYGGNYSGMAYSPGTVGPGKEGRETGISYPGLVISLAAALLAQQEPCNSAIHTAFTSHLQSSQHNGTQGAGAPASGGAAGMTGTITFGRRLSGAGDAQVPPSVPGNTSLPPPLAAAAELLSRAGHYPGALKAAELAVGKLRPLLCEPPANQNNSSRANSRALKQLARGARRRMVHGRRLAQAGAGAAGGGGDGTAVRKSEGGRGGRVRGVRQGVCGCLRLGELQVLGELEAELGHAGDFLLLTPLKAAMSLNRQALSVAHSQEQQSNGAGREGTLRAAGAVVAASKRLQAHPWDRLMQLALRGRSRLEQAGKLSSCSSTEAAAADCAVELVSAIVTARCGAK